MNHVKAILRRSLTERQAKGTPDDRERAIELFLGELQELFTPRFIEALDEKVLAGMIVDWLRAIKYLDHEQRLEALIKDTRLCEVPFLVYKPTEQPPRRVAEGNVVSLYAR